MTTGRLCSITTLAVLLNCLLLGVVFVGVGFGDDTGKSGLDFNQGYDINTVTTVSGQVASLPRQGQRENYFFEIKNGNESINIFIGPGSFWEKKEIPVHLNDKITAKGSQAQGQDGKLYLLTQKLVNRTTGAQLELRNDKGEPTWSGRSMNVMRPERPAGVGRQQGGAMMRGGGGMMRR
ncbi:MAG: hypothetical protein WA133_07195 [Syntrophales bacterium]